MKKCVLCKTEISLDISPSSILKMILNYFYSKNLNKQALEIKNKIESELNNLKNLYSDRILYPDGIKDIPLCKNCIRDLFKNNLDGKTRDQTLNILDKIIK